MSVLTLFSSPEPACFVSVTRDNRLKIWDVVRMPAHGCDCCVVHGRRDSRCRHAILWSDASCPPISRRQPPTCCTSSRRRIILQLAILASRGTPT